MRPSRREVILGVPLLTAGCAARRNPISAPSPIARLPRVLVSPDRVIRTVVGLRPYRPSGFVVKAEKLDDKTVIHNYGHGGAGITLSWGTAQLAVNEAAQITAKDCAVIGGGISGLSTARLLQLRGYNPTIYTRALPPATTSNIAGGLWEPVSLYDHTRITPEFRRQYGEAARFAFRYFQTLAGDYYGVRWLPLFMLSRGGPFQPPPPESAASDIEPLYPERKQLPRDENPFDVPYAHRRYSMLIEPSIYLNAIVRDYLLNGGRFVIRDFQTKSDLQALKETVLFNCTGLGSRTLFGDEELMPIRGQLVILLPQPEIQYMTLGPGPIYMFPRRDGILLGGTFDRGDSNLEPDPATTTRILSDSRTLFDGMRPSPTAP